MDNSTNWSKRGLGSQGLCVGMRPATKGRYRRYLPGSLLRTMTLKETPAERSSIQRYLKGNLKIYFPPNFRSIVSK